MDEKNLYQSVKKKICRMIYEGIYEDGDFIPPERKLAEDLGVSRVTLRRALQLLEEERIIQRIQGSGNRVSLQYGAHHGDMDIITLVAPAQNRFFSRFIDAFQTTAEELDSLVLFKQKPPRISLEDCLFQIYEKNLKNVVLWPEDMELPGDSLAKLRGLGMNIVLFDTSYRTPYADGVCLHNGDAVRRLYERLVEKGCRRIGFVGWDEKRVLSACAREREYVRLSKDPVVYRVPWKYRNEIENIPRELLLEGLAALKDCDGILYSVAELGIPFERKAKEQTGQHHAAMIDYLPGAEELDILVMEQDFQKMSEKIFGCLKRQNLQEGAWKADVYRIKGKLLS